MRKRIMKKSEVLKEGYVKGLKKAQSVINEMLDTSINQVVYHATPIFAKLESGNDAYTDVNDVENDFSDVDFTSAESFKAAIANQNPITDIRKVEVEWFSDEDNEESSGYLIVSFIGDDEGYQLSKDEYNLWKAGKLDANIVKTYFEVSCDVDNAMMQMFN